MNLSKFKNTDFLLISISFGIITTLMNYSFGNNDQIEQLPIIYRFLDSNYLINDFFVNSNDGYSPRYFYTNLIVFLAKFVSIPTLFFFGTLLSNISISVISFLTTKRLFNNVFSGLIAAALVMTAPLVAIGTGKYLYGTQFNPTTLVFPLILLSFYFLIQRKLFYSLCITGVVSLFHVLIGFEYGVLFLSAFLFLDFYHKKNLKSFLRKGVFGASIIVAFLLPNLIPYYSSNSTIDTTTFIEIVANFRHPHHYILSHILTLKETIKIFIFFSVFIFLLYSWKSKTKNQFHSKLIKLLAAILVFLNLIGWMFTEIISTKLITTLQFLRLLDLLKWIAVLFVANKIALWVQYKINLARFKTIVFAVLLLFVSSRYLINLKNSQTERNYFSLHVLEKSKSDISNFIQENTNKNSLFLVPHDFGFLRVHSKRAIVVDYKSFPFQNKAMQEWYKRIENCYGLEKDEFENQYRLLTDEKIMALYKEYGFDYAILHPETSTKIPVLYKNKDYKIVHLIKNVQ